MDRAKSVDWSLYVVTDSHLVGQRPLADVVAAAVRGGGNVIQYREKQAATRTMVERASAIGRVCRSLGACFLVNDRLDVALAVDADGIHVGQDDMPAQIARKLLGPGKLLGVTVHNLEEMRAAERNGADYVSIAPVFATATKPDHQEPLGVEGVRVLASSTHLPAFAIAGIDRSNAGDVIRSGVRGVCVVSAVIAAPDPEQAARELRQLIEAARRAS